MKKFSIVPPKAWPAIIGNFQFSVYHGQTLIETLAALGIISIVITAIGISVTTALSNAKYNQYETLATKYAQQGTEIMTQMRDDNYTNFKGYNGSYCLPKDQTILSAGPCTANIDKIFVRSVTIAQGGCGVNVAQVTVSVAFADGKCQTGVYCHSQTDVSCLSTLNPVQAP
jgi:type II secretory pathway pseudopilin PulG